MEIICPTCKKTREVSARMIRFIQHGDNTGRCKSCATKGNKSHTGLKASAETRLKMRLASLGKKKSPEHARNIGIGHKGLVAVSGKKQWLWKGDNVSYHALHHWVNTWKGKPKECVYCGEEFNRLHWASISHKAKRDLDDYIPLCSKCHKGYDLKGGYIYG